ncbi:amidohydrolase family protein [Pseudodesulfovibrio sp. JC047]|uniref:amidohydrolase family protein n=1 Tax=Pseudodesulfovibrio sp. JC047 TaxID=2683199 RepID=UPI0013CF6E8D|nr:amidohydrolase family protein [Pseudodesulfovibrio sp. JC047]
MKGKTPQDQQDSHANSRRDFLKTASAAAVAVGIGVGMAHTTHAAMPASPLMTKDEEGHETLLIKNVNIFDGTHDQLKKGMSVLIKGNTIVEISTNFTVPHNTKIIDGGGRTLTPGFIDIHTHLQFNVGPHEFMAAPADYHGALALWEANNTLMRGFTTMRDVGGSVWGVKRAIDEGYFPGPRLYSSGSVIGMTAGHGDYRTTNTFPRQLGGASETEIERLGMTYFADGVPEVLSASRTVMRSGAAFIKMFVGGAVSGLYDPLDVAEYSLEEIKAAAHEADRWNTYLAVHTYTDKATMTSIEAGAKTLEHCNLIGEKTVKHAVKNGCYISAQTGVYLSPAPESFTPAQVARQQQAAEGLDNLLTLCQKHKAKVAFGCDLLASLASKETQCTEFVNRTKWFSNVEILKQATSVNGEILALSGPRNPYPGKLGVIEKGALADVLLINGNPLKDLDLLLNPDENIAVIVKDGKVYKDTLSQHSIG